MLANYRPARRRIAGALLAAVAILTCSRYAAAAAAPNIDRILCFATRPADRAAGVATLREVEERYRFAAAGANFYYGINPENRARFNATGRALARESHRSFFGDILGSLGSPGAGDAPQERTVVLGLEPPQSADPYGFVAANMRLCAALADELRALQEEARSRGGRLRIVIRYASEMNDDGRDGRGRRRNRYAGAPARYRESFRAVRELFRGRAPGVAFAFSPAIRHDLGQGGLPAYWPGDRYVDVISCTWYVGSGAQYRRATAGLRSYLLRRVGKGKPFAIDEMGGCAGRGRDNDPTLRRMMGELAGLAGEGVTFTHVTLFLKGKWGADATLSWLSPTPRPARYN